MKKLFPKILILALAVLLAVFIAACDKKAESSSDEGHNEYETTLYTVTYSTNGGLSDFSQFNLTDVPSGSFISAPKYSDGSLAIPSKIGYTFAYWSANGADAFDFATTPVTSNLTLTAIYTSRQYKHTPNITAELKKNADGTYSVTDGVYTSGNFETPGENEFSSYYNSSSGTFKVPTTTLAGDWFVFWYYINDEGKPVRFTTMASETSTTESLMQLTAYKFTKPLTLYAMWHSQLPKVNVVFKDSLSDEVYKEFECALTDFVDETEKPNMSEAKEGYAFDKWYYIVTDKDGVETLRDFTFDVAEEADDNPTSPATAAGITSEFEGGTLTLLASWKKLVTITNVTEFETLYNDLRGDDEEKINTILNATIKIAGTIDFGDMTFEPLFDAEHKFLGVIDGGKPDENGNIVENSKIVGGKFGSNVSASVFGYVAGEIKNLDFENVGLLFERPENDGTTFVAGTVATMNSGKISNVTVTISSLDIDISGSSAIDGVLKDGLSSIVFGGLVGKNGGEVSAVSVTISSLDSLSESLTLGGIAGENTSRISNSTVSVNVDNVLCVDDKMSADGLPFAKIGGVTASNGGGIIGVFANVNVTVDSKNGLDFGGISATNLGEIKTSHSSVNLVATSGASSNLGGLVGNNTGYINNSYAEARLGVTYDSASSSVNVGGVIGNANGGTLSSSYASGSINLTTARASKVYAGGIIGVDNSCIVTYSFAVVDVDVSNEGENFVASAIGQDKNGKLRSAWYAEESALTLNGETLGTRGVGIATALANLKSADFVIGTSSTVKFDVGLWQIDGDNLPTLKDNLI